MGEGEVGGGRSQLKRRREWSSINSILTALFLEAPAKRSIDQEATHQWEQHSLDKILLSWTTAGHRYAKSRHIFFFQKEALRLLRERSFWRTKSSHR
jgi:hypothetical protein